MKRRLLVASTAAAVVVAGGGVAYAQAQGPSGAYRTATVTVGDVDRTLTLSGTIAASSRQDLSFGVAGAVTKVGVEVGDVVKAGTVLATLDDADLKTAVTKARATLAKAQAQLASDQSSQSSTVTTAATGGSGSTGSSKQPSSGSSSTVSPRLKAALAALKQQQGAVTAAQTEATTAIAAAKTALAAQSDACKTPDGTDPPSDAADPASSGGSDACTTALDAVQAAQDVVAAKQDTLQAALGALAKTLGAAVTEIQKSSTPAPGSSSSPSGSGTSESRSTGSSGAGAGGGSGGGTATAATLAQDQAAIDTAKAALTEAKRNRDAADLTAPFGGKILSVSAAKGDSVSADDVVAVIVGTGGTTAKTTVTAAQVADVKKGQTASVSPAGGKPVTGTVTSIGLLPDSSTDSATYPVTLDLRGSVAAPEGSTASIALVIGTAKNALTVPSSAVSTTGRTTVSVLTDGNPVRTAVTVGVVGPTRTSITQGLTKGQEVVIADLDAALPSGDSTTTRFPGAGGFGGAPGARRQQRAAG
ncbi:efflux RND transporter periplasmic adaptor subunit [Aeromicrobium ginsengisoli]|uniref:efflux RND transporter periplasmic adaptor subunit n=1 Tax=Aeromicrobium ginsengisoli TaxID=363867 RepID=UPI00165F186D|nr:HlyD family efflux transporter periplasmic adaptor subunit [Aeromicrobium ginsengisoli]